MFHMLNFRSAAVSTKLLGLSIDKGLSFSVSVWWLGPATAFEYERDGRPCHTSLWDTTIDSEDLLFLFDLSNPRLL